MSWQFDYHDVVQCVSEQIWLEDDDDDDDNDDCALYSSRQN